MDIKDSYLHGTVGVVKSIDVNADTLTYTLADSVNTAVDVTLDLATTTANGLLSSTDKRKLDDLSTNFVTIDTDQDIIGIKTFKVANNTSPFKVNSDTKVENLNSDYLDGKSATDFCYNVDQQEIDCNAPLHGSHSAIYRFPNEPNNAFPRASYGNLLVVGSGFDTVFLLGAPYLEEALYFRTGVYKTDYTSSDGINKRSWKLIAFTESDITGNADTATQLKNPRKLWGLLFDGSADVKGDMDEVGLINSILTVEPGTTNSILNIKAVEATKDYLSMWVSSSTDTNEKTIPLVLQYNYGNVGIGTTSPTEKLEVNGNIKSESFIGNLDGMYVDKLTNYTKSNKIENIKDTDSLNAALGKLEFKTDFIYEDLFGEDEDTVINKWHEIVDFIDSVSETETDILDTFVTRKTPLDIIGYKTFLDKVTINSTTANQTPSLIFEEFYGENPTSWSSTITSDYFGDNVCGTDGFTHGLFITLGREGFDNLNIIDSGKKPIARISAEKGHYFEGSLTANNFVANSGDILTWGANEEYNIGNNETNNDFYLWSQTASKLKFGTNNTERLSILANGNVGINTANPEYLLDVNGDTSIKGVLYLGNDATNNYLAFCGTTGDGPEGFNHTYIGEHATNNNEISELILFKGNDPASNASGPDRIRHIAALHVFQVYNTAFLGDFDSVCSSAVPSNILTISGNDITSYTDILPAENNIYNLGSSSLKWANVYATKLYGELDGNALTASSIKSIDIGTNTYSLSSAQWTNVNYDISTLIGTYIVLITSGSDLVASGLMSVCNKLDTMGDEIPLHVFGTTSWRPYLRTFGNKLLISSNDVSRTSRTVTIKIALII